MFWLLLSSAHPALLERRGARSQTGAQPVQVTWSGHRDVPHHRTPCPLYNCGELVGMGQSLLGDRLGTGQWVVIVLGIAFVSWVLFLSLSRSHIHSIIIFGFTIILSAIIQYFISIINLLSPQPTRFSFSSLILLPTGGEEAALWCCTAGQSQATTIQQKTAADTPWIWALPCKIPKRNIH